MLGSGRWRQRLAVLFYGLDQEFGCLPDLARCLNWLQRKADSTKAFVRRWKKENHMRGGFRSSTKRKKMSDQ